MPDTGVSTEPGILREGDKLLYRFDVDGTELSFLNAVRIEEKPKPAPRTKASSNAEEATVEELEDPKRPESSSCDCKDASVQVDDDSTPSQCQVGQSSDVAVQTGDPVEMKRRMYQQGEVCSPVGKAAAGKFWIRAMPAKTTTWNREVDHKVLWTLRHENVVRYYGLSLSLDFEPRHFAFLTEHCSYFCTLFGFMLGNCDLMDPGQIQQLTRQLLSGVSYLHSHKIILCNLSVYTLFLQAKMDDVVLKIGAYEFSPVIRYTSDVAPASTNGSVSQFLVPYAAPEWLQCLCEANGDLDPTDDSGLMPDCHTGPHTDVWSCGRVVQALLLAGSGKPIETVFTRDVEEESKSVDILYLALKHRTKLSKAVEDEIQQWSRSNAGADISHLQSFLSDCLQEDPHARLPLEKLLQHPWLSLNNHTTRLAFCLRSKLVSDELRVHVVLRLLGRGTFGSVYAVQEMITDLPFIQLSNHSGLATSFYFLRRMPVLIFLGMPQFIYNTARVNALKTIELRHLAGCSNQERLLQEYRSEREHIFKMDHVNLVKYYDMDIVNLDNPLVVPSVRMVMDFCSKGTLKTLMEGAMEPFSYAEIHGFCGQILKGLKHLHDNQVVHGDLKPSNIMLELPAALSKAKFTVKIGDYDGSALLAGAATVSGDRLPDYTKNYAAPEVKDDGKPGRASDIWSFGVITEELTGCCGGCFERRSSLLLREDATASASMKDRLLESSLGNFIWSCKLTQADRRPKAAELTEHPWMCNVPQRQCTVL